MIKVKILIIDDEVDYCMIMKSYFERRNYEVYLAYNLANGLSLAEKAPDVLFLDNNLPDGQGWQHAGQIVENNPSLKINLISAYKQKTNGLSAVPNIKVWEKPISLASLEELFAPSN